LQAKGCEIDFAVVGPTGKVLLIEQKAGLLSGTPGGLAKKYAGKEKNVPMLGAQKRPAAAGQRGEPGPTALPDTSMPFGRQMALIIMRSRRIWRRVIVA